MLHPYRLLDGSYNHRDGSSWIRYKMDAKDSNESQPSSFGKTTLDDSSHPIWHPFQRLHYSVYSLYCLLRDHLVHCSVGLWSNNMDTFSGHIWGIDVLWSTSMLPPYHQYPSRDQNEPIKYECNHSGDDRNDGNIPSLCHRLDHFDHKIWELLPIGAGIDTL